VKTVYSSPNLALVHHFKNILEGCGIPCQIRKEYLSSGAGDLPLTDCWPELCVADDGLFAEASRLIEEALSPEGERGVEWKCRGCGKTIEPSGAVNAPPPKGGGFGLRLKSAISAKADVSLLKQA
jgi:hypothetical protein